LTHSHPVLILPPGVFLQEIFVKNKLGGMILLAAAAVLSGCRTTPAPAPASPPPVASVEHPSSEAPKPPTTTAAATSGNEVIASVAGISVTRSQLENPLLESYGLPMLLNIIQLDLAREQVRIHKLHVSPEDIQNERALTLALLFPDAGPSDYESLLDQYLNQKRISRADFDLALETNANLRRLAEPQLTGRITDAMVHQAFGELYGENRQIRDIELSNMREIAEARRRLAAGEPFEKVASELSHDPQTRPLGGELPQFSSQSPNVPKAIKDSTFALQVGQISDPIQDGDAYHLILLEKIIPPKIVKFEDVKDYVRKELEDQWVHAAIMTFRTQLGQLAMQTMEIDDPILKQKWQEMKEQAEARRQDRDEIRDQITRNRPATAPATEPASLPTSMPAAPLPAAGPTQPR
jgi:foldase protein PrsA